jgi:hypothetical protein
MKKWLVFFNLLLLLFTCTYAAAQSPYLSVRLAMDTAGKTDARYAIAMKICSLKKPTLHKDWFSFEKSKVNFETLGASGVQCGNYIENGGGLEYLAGDPGLNPFNEYEFGNQNFAFESILVFRIADSSAKESLPMYVVFPVKYKSFVTSIFLTGVPFQPGKVVYLKDATIDRSSNLRLKASLKKVKGVAVKDFRWKEIL